MKEDLLLLLERERVLIPYGTSKTIAWEDRVLTFRPGETYEVPHVIRNMLNRAAETGELDPRYAFKEYLRKIGEPEPETTTSYSFMSSITSKTGEYQPARYRRSLENYHWSTGWGR